MTQQNGDTPTPGIPTANDLGGTDLRTAIASYLGDSLYDSRQYYDTFDWPSVGGIDEEQYYATYLRNPFARPVVDRPAKTAWRDGPIIVDDDEDEQTEFEDDLETAVRELDLWSFGERLDRLAGIGRFGVLVWITDDISGPGDLSDPISPDEFQGDGLDAVTQLKVFSEVSIENISWGDIENADEGRWGKPVSYSIDFSPEANTADEGMSDRVYDVHWTRTIAAPATPLLDDDFMGRPRLEPVFNTLRDIEKTMGAVAEMGYRGAEKGFALNFDPEAVDTSPGGDFMSQMEDEMQEWHHGLRWFFRTAGADIQELGGEIAELQNIFDPHLSALATATGIPKRVFQGDPAGALASAEEDTQAYFGMIQERRDGYAAPHIVRPQINWLVDHGIIAAPESDHPRIDWQPLRVLSEKEQVALAAERAKALAPVLPVGTAYELFGVELPESVEGMSDEMLGAVGGGGGGGPGSALDMALNDIQTRARASARTEARIQRGKSD